jgi:DNA-binding LytR/AlgR family response regulator
MYKILVVDDERKAREYLAELIAVYLPDAEIEKADHPQKAIAFLQQEDFDMLFVDIRMQEMTGLEMLQSIRGTIRLPYTVLVSAFREFDYAVKGIELGVADYLTKPLSKTKIYETIRLYLQRADRNTLVFNVPQGLRRINTEHILAIQTVDYARVKIYTSDAVIPLAMGTLSKLCQALPAHFRYIRRNCIVNCHAITDYSLKTNEVTIVCRNGNMTLQVSRENMKELAIRLKDR